MRTKQDYPGGFIPFQRRLLGVVVAVLIIFSAGALVIYATHPSTREVTRLVGYLLIGTSAVLIAAFIISYAALRLAQRRGRGL
jgi:hypothetical protein